MDLTALAGLTPAAFRALLPGFLSGYVADADARARNQAEISALVAGWDDATCAALRDGLVTIGAQHRVYPADKAGRALSRLWARSVIVAHEVTGAEHLRAALKAGPTVILCNHLAYFDATATDAVLAWAGHQDLADHVAYLAGPKVYEDLFRRVAAVCLHTLPVPQSTTLAHTESLPPKELARRALSSLAAGRTLVERGDALLLYPEGSRSRTGHLGSFLKGTWRYLDLCPGVRVVPMVIEGTDHIMPVGATSLHAGAVRLQVLPAIAIGADEASGALRPRDALAAAWHRIAEVLPVPLQPAPGTDPVV